MKTLKIIYLAAILSLFLLVSCEKDGQLIVVPVKEYKPFKISGFVVGDTLQQYFDGVKVREYYGNVSVINTSLGYDEMAFAKDEINMQLKRKSTGETVYQQNFNISSEMNEVPKFYFDGTKFSDRYVYPAPVGAAYTANFYFDFPKGSPAVDIVLGILEYYADRSSGSTVNIILGVTFFPQAENIQIGKWSDYIQLQPVPVLPKNNPQSKFINYVCLKKHGSDEFYINIEGDVMKQMTKNSFKLVFPSSSATQGKVQSFHISQLTDYTGTSFKPADLVPLFPQ